MMEVGSAKKFLPGVAQPKPIGKTFCDQFDVAGPGFQFIRPNEQAHQV